MTLGRIERGFRSQKQRALPYPFLREIMGKFVAVYCRVSTRKQDTRSQVRELERWVDSCSDPVRWYDDEYTGTRMDRPGWN